MRLSSLRAPSQPARTLLTWCPPPRPLSCDPCALLDILIPRQGEGSSTATEAAATEVTTTETSTAIVKTDGKKAQKGKGVERFAESDIIYADDEVPFGPLGVFPENYSEVQAKVCTRGRTADESGARGICPVLCRAPGPCVYRSRCIVGGFS